jgi:cell division protein FtsQ
MRPRLTPRRALLAGIVAAAAATPFWAPPVLRQLAWFRVERVEVSGVHLLAPHEVLAAAQIRADQNVWDDPRPWLSALAAHPMIRDARVERALPRTLRLRIEERRPVGFVLAGALRPAAADGSVLPVDPARAPVDLPLVRTGRVSAADARVTDEDALFLLAEAGHLGELDPGLLARVSEMRRTPAGDVLLTLGTPAIELLLPPRSGLDRLRQLRAVLEHVETRAAGFPPSRPVRVDLRFADQVVVRLPSS